MATEIETLRTNLSQAFEPFFPEGVWKMLDRLIELEVGGSHSDAIGEDILPGGQIDVAIDDAIDDEILPGGAIDVAIRAIHEAGASVKTKSDDYVAITTDCLIMMTGANKTITLPPLADAYDGVTEIGSVFTLFKDVAGGLLTIDPDGAETMVHPDYGVITTAELALRYESIKVIATASTWVIV